MIKINAPFSADSAKKLKAGDSVLLSGVIYTARDAAHKRLKHMIDNSVEPPFELKGQAIYYAGPCPTPLSKIIGSCGPTSAVRMNAYAPALYDKGVACVIAKGPVSEEVVKSIIRNNAVYLCAAGGAGALLSKCVAEAREIAFPDLGTESVKRLVVKDMPLIVGIDCAGGSLFK